MRVLIVGGGIAGMALAGLLYRRGIEPLVVEQSPFWREFGYAIGLWPNGMRVLKRLGVADAVRARGKQMTAYTIRDATGDPLRTFDLASISKPFGYTLQTHRAWLHESLRQAVPSHLVRMGTSVAEIVQTGTGVDVEFTDMSRASFDLVVGADGFHSITRRLLFGPEGEDYSGVTVWCFWAPPDFDVPDELTDVWGSEGRYCSILPLPGRTAIHLAMAFDEPPRDPLETRVERVKQRFGDLPWVISDAVKTLSDPKSIVTAHIFQVQLKHWHDGRVVLIGDKWLRIAQILPDAVSDHVARLDAEALGGLSRPGDKFAGLPLVRERPDVFPPLLR